MTRYSIDYAPKAEKQLRAVRDARLALRLKRAIDLLAENPRPDGCLKLVGEVDQWRVRVGDWRIVYVIEDGRLLVLVVTVAPRGGAYRGL
ncbi:type II toxin-antitoxin system RelE/ParE family toxin [Rhodobacter sp. Har01]|uniref:type II toxin-antitoxin system RelE family toxin n=1 Tax=Rhodobacter sp. Har01 TaxID=2883999 RepID=UPI001D063FDA|nr:type II toxin-antitoxin system RelE/ParE family toxin [Rhodobacter sp. Har01]MCB6178242.1 type II toxin-antitoxin system RelE/ParE family toxin [Rhodobacter sp. Har01]